mmetsp:Transcript_45162/g.88657  ORF Transcript_45162/g.88657 Transcript_45162/m.88657 type:complete len:220 (+) Transcript_45162:153-812(+)
MTDPTGEGETGTRTWMTGTGIGTAGTCTRLLLVPLAVRLGAKMALPVSEGMTGTKSISTSPISSRCTTIGLLARTPTTERGKLLLNHLGSRVRAKVLCSPKKKQSTWTGSWCLSRLEELRMAEMTGTTQTVSTPCKTPFETCTPLLLGGVWTKVVKMTGSGETAVMTTGAVATNHERGIGTTTQQIEFDTETDRTGWHHHSTNQVGKKVARSIVRALTS